MGGGEPVEPVELCGECAAAHVHGQRYCLSCGARLVDGGSLLAALLERVPSSERPPMAQAGVAGSGGEGTAPPARSSRGGRMSVPAPPRARVWAALALGFLGFGVLLGGAAGRPESATLASARGPLKVVLAATPTSSTSTPSGAEEAPAGEEAEPPASEAAPTPSPAQPNPAPAAKPTSQASQGSTASEEAGGEGTAAAPANKPPAIRHVFVVMLSDEPYASVFGPASTAHYLSQTLEHRGALLVRYDAVAHEQLANELALLSGQGPTVETAANCQAYADISQTGGAADEQVLGSGCVYPAKTRTIVGQLAAKHLTARAYIQGMDEPGAGVGACGHPSPGQADPTGGEAGSGAYATFRNPFVYFHSVLDTSACAGEDVGLSRLTGDLALGKRAPSLLYIAPDRCHDGDPVPCAAAAVAGMAPVDAFLSQWIPRIMASKAYKDGGLIVITSDEAPSSGEFADSSSCCGEPRYPNLAAPSAGGPTGHGGGTVGALLLSPFIAHSSTSQEPYSHFSLLRTIEDIFGVAHLGYAALPDVKPFEPSLFSSAKG